MTLDSIDSFTAGLRQWLRGEKYYPVHGGGVHALLRLQSQGGLTPNAFMIGIAICVGADPENGLCSWPLAEIGERVGIRRKKSLAIAIKNLTAAGFLELVPAAEKKTQYQISLRAGSALGDSEPGAETAPPPESKTRSDSEPGANSVLERMDFVKGQGNDRIQ
jgi:hypothetical protein